jgi:DNA repair exonuclease SbcCD ATPase subunit
MKQIQFKKIKLLNFCGIRNAEYEFGDALTIIKGKNGIGKSTIANAILYTLFGKNINGDSLDIKTFDKDHNIIKEVPHEVELTVRVLCTGSDGASHKVIVLKRTLTDSWKGEECRNTFKYYVDGEISTASDFKNVVDSICPEDVFRLCSSTRDFVCRPWQDQRNKLQALVGNITTDDITQGDKKFDFVIEALRKQDIDKYVHHIKYKRKEVQEQLDAVPIRLEELNKSLPEVQDWEALSTEKAQLNEKLVELANKMQEIRTGGADKVRLDAIRKKIDFANKRKMNMEQGALNLATEIATKHQSDILTANAAVASSQRLVDDLKAEMKGLNDTKIHAGKQKEECEKQANEINQKNDEANASTWEWNAEDGICPHCGQPLPSEDVERIKKESEQNFNNRKANTLKKLDEDFDKLQETYTNLKKILEDADKYMQDNMNNMTAAQKQLKEAEFKKLEVDADKPKTYEQILAEKEEYQQVVKELADLQAELDKPSETSSEDSAKMLAELEKEREPIGIRYNEVLELLGTKESFDRITARIAEINEDKLTYQTQLDELDEKLDIASEYNQKACQLLEDRVNELFSFVKWSMFKTNLKGEREATCECYHNGVPYRRLNTAAKVNAGIDIAYAFAKCNEIEVPMLLDECESVNHPICRGGQQIRMVVTTDDELKFEYPAPTVME